VHARLNEFLLRVYLQENGEQLEGAAVPDLLLHEDIEELLEDDERLGRGQLGVSGQPAEEVEVEEVELVGGGGQLAEQRLQQQRQRHVRQPVEEREEVEHDQLAHLQRLVQLDQEEDQRLVEVGRVLRLELREVLEQAEEADQRVRLKQKGLRAHAALYLVRNLRLLLLREFLVVVEPDVLQQSDRVELVGAALELLVQKELAF